MALVFNLTEGEELVADGPIRIVIGEKSGRRTKLVVIPDEGVKVAKPSPAEGGANFAGKVGLTRGVGDQE